MKSIRLIKPVAHDGEIYPPGFILSVPNTTAEFLCHSSPPWAEFLPESGGKRKETPPTPSPQ